VASGPLTPRPTAAEALRIFSAASTPFIYVAPWPKGPTVVVIGSGPTLGPWTMPPPVPARRLDGTLLTNPPIDYWSRPSFIFVPIVDQLHHHR
jgi:hypothetical protein